MSIGSLIKALKHDRLAYGVRPLNEPERHKYLGVLAESLEGAESFVLDSSPVGDPHDLSQGDGIRDWTVQMHAPYQENELVEIYETIEAMQEMDLLRLPYDIIYVELDFMMRLRPDQVKGYAKRNPGKSVTPLACKLGLIVAEQVATGKFEGELPEGHFMMWPFLQIPSVWGDKYWKDLSIMCWTSIVPRDQGVEVQKPSFLDWPNADAALTEIAEIMAVISRDTLATLLVYLSTRGIHKETVFRGDPVKLKARGKPIDHYTTVRIPKEGPKAQNGDGRRSEEQFRRRLHLRRGHVRHQRCGIKLCRIKKIWIEPMLVGCEDEGKITHREYELE